MRATASQVWICLPCCCGKREQPILTNASGGSKAICALCRTISRFTEHVDAVVNLFTSFGYFEEDTEQLKVLRQIRKALRPGGRFVIDVLNAMYTAHHLVPYSEREVQGAVISETRHIESGFVVKEIFVREPDRPARRYTERVKLYTLETMTALLNEAGLVVDMVYGSYDGEVYDACQSRRMILVCYRDEGALASCSSMNSTPSPEPGTIPTK